MVEQHGRCVGSPVPMSIYTCARGVREYFDKNGAIWCILSVPKYVIINLKINNFKDNKSTTTKQSIRNIFSNIIQMCMSVHKQIHVHVTTEGGGGSGCYLTRSRVNV